MNLDQTWPVWLMACLVTLTSIYVAGGPVWRLLRKPAKTKEREFLEAALDDDVKDRPATSKYSWDEFQKDLHDGGMTFEELYEKYEGVFPLQPKATAGGPGESSRAKELKSWWEANARQAWVVPVVDPPPPPKPVIIIKGQAVPCYKCSPGSGPRRFDTTDLGGVHRRDLGVKCSGCGGKGFILITHG